MATTIARRQGVKSRQIFYAEPDNAMGTDPPTPVGYIMPLADESGFGSEQGLIEAPVFKGNRKPHGVVYGNINASGEAPYGLEFRTFGRVLRTLVGPNGYVRPGGGTTKLHRFFAPIVLDAVPGSCQIQDESLETPKQVLRNRGTRPGSINLSYANEGVARYGVGYTGIGDEVQTDLGGTVNDEGYSGVNYFNGHAKLNNYFLVGMNGFSIVIDGGVSRGDAAFRDGIGASVDFGVINITGSLGLMFATAGTAPENNMNFYNMAVNQSKVPLEVAWSDKPKALATMWCRVILPGVSFSRRGFRSGGAAGKLITQDYRISQDEAANKIFAEKFGTINGPYNIIGATNHILGVKINGGATIPVTLTLGAARTTDQVVTDLNTSGPFSAVAVASNFMGKVMVASKALGALGSVQVDTAQATSAHTVLGFDGIVFTGFNDTAWLIEIYNDLGVDYIGGV